MMGVRLPKRAQRRLFHLAVILFVYLSVWYLILPLDSPLRLAIHFNLSRFRGFRSSSAYYLSRDDYLYASPPPHPLDLSADIGYLIKTGYGTRHRVPEQIEAFRQTGNLLGREGQSYLVVGDWTAINATDEAETLGATVHDALKMVLETKLGPEFEETPRFVKYRSLQRAVDTQDEDKASSLGKSFGWELDALKFVLGMDLLYNSMPDKKWYIILDDDTYLVRPSLHLLLNNLDPRQPLYIGNAVGDYRGRFAHGGSAVIVSGEAMRRLFKRPDIVKRAYLDSLDETWGDKLVATTLQKVGVYLDERYNHHFNGEHPEITRIGGDRFCSPVVSFHGLRRPGDMARVSRVLGRAPQPVLWGHLWDLFASYPMQNLAHETVQMDQDHVGEAEGRTRERPTAGSADMCKAICDGDGGSCLAWTFVPDQKKCITSQSVIIGAEVAQGRASGVNWARLDAMRRQCPTS